MFKKNRIHLNKVIVLFFISLLMVIIGTIFFIFRPYNDESSSYTNQKNANLVFVNTKCNKCNQVRKTINALKFFNHIIVIETNLDKNINLIDKFEIKATPEFIKIRDGQVKETYIGTNNQKIRGIIK